MQERVEKLQEISIHAPRVGSDEMAPCHYDNRRISIHAPRVGSDDFSVLRNVRLAVFQSTLPVWGATHAQANAL